MIVIYILFVVYLVVNIGCDYSKGKKDSLQKPIYAKLPNKIKHEQINEEDVVTASSPINVNEELSSTSNKQYYVGPKPENVRIIHDLYAEIERLAHLKLGNEEPTSKEKPQINLEDGLYIKKPTYTRNYGSYRIYDDISFYTDPFLFIPTILLYAISLPLFSYFMCYGRAMSKESIPAISAFVFYFTSFLLLKRLWILGVLLSLSVAFIAHRIALKPLKKFRLGPRSIRNEPIGWILIIMTCCIVLSNLLYKLLFMVLRSIFVFLHFPTVIRTGLPLFYILFLALASLVILTILTTTVPTEYAQNSVLSLTCSYIVFSGISYFNDLIVCNVWTKMKPILLDPVQFFESKTITNVNQLVMIILVVSTALYTTSNIK